MSVPSLLARVALLAVLSLTPMTAVDAAVFYWQGTGTWLGTGPGGVSTFNFTVGFDNGGSSTLSQTYNPATDLVSFAMTSGAFEFDTPPLTNIITGASFTTDSSGLMTAGNATINGVVGGDSFAGTSAPSFQLNFNDNDPDFYGSDGNRYRFGWTLSMSPVSVPEPGYLFGFMPFVLFVLGRRRRL